MFPLQRGNELVIQFSNSPHHQQQHKISQDLILDDYASLDDNVSAKKFSTSQPQNLFYHPDKNNHHDSNQHMKKMIHKEIERQRRQEMATCYASLRSLLPLHFIKVKHFCFFIFLQLVQLLASDHLIISILVDTLLEIRPLYQLINC